MADEEPLDDGLTVAARWARRQPMVGGGRGLGKTVASAHHFVEFGILERAAPVGVEHVKESVDVILRHFEAHREDCLAKLLLRHLPRRGAPRAVACSAGAQWAAMLGEALLGTLSHHARAVLVPLPEEVDHASRGAQQRIT